MADIWNEISCITSDVSVLRKCIFAASYLPKDAPNYWETVTDFAFKHSSITPSSAQVRMLLENIDFIDQQAFHSDRSLFEKFISEVHDSLGQPVGVVLVSTNSSCKLCGGSLLIRADRPSHAY